MDPNKRNSKVILGVGNQLRGDDGAGSYFAASFKVPGWHSFDGGSLPENFAGPIRRLKPSLIVVVDACQMDLEPGEFRRIALAQLSEEQPFSTHSASLMDLLLYLEKYAGPVVFVGIQPLSTHFEQQLSQEVKMGLSKLKELLLTVGCEAIKLI